MLIPVPVSCQEFFVASDGLLYGRVISGKRAAVASPKATTMLWNGIPSLFYSPRMRIRFCFPPLPLPLSASGGPLLAWLSNSITPLYFRVSSASAIPATRERCDVALEYEDGQLHLAEELRARGLPSPREHNRLHVPLMPFEASILRQ